MASVTLSLCSSLVSHCRISSKQNPSFSNNTNLNFLSLSSHKLSLSSSSSSPTFHFLPKSSESETAVLDAETESPVIASEPEPEAAQIVQTSSEQVPKREQVFAVVMVSNGKTTKLYAFFQWFWADPFDAFWSHFFTTQKMFLTNLHFLSVILFSLDDNFDSLYVFS